MCFCNFEEEGDNLNIDLYQQEKFTYFKTMNSLEFMNDLGIFSNLKFVKVVRHFFEDKNHLNVGNTIDWFYENYLTRIFNFQSNFFIDLIAREDEKDGFALKKYYDSS